MISGYLKIVLLASIFLLPLLGAYKGFGYEQSKILFFILSISLIGFMWMGRGFKWSGISKAAGLFILVLLATSLMGVNLKNSLLGIPPYFQGLILYCYLFLFFLLVSWSKIKFEHWAMILSGSATLVGLLAIKDWVLLNIFHQLIPTYADRVVSTFGQPNFYAGFILLTLPFCHFLLVKNDKNWYVMVGFLISIVAIILSQSRTAYLILSGLMIIWLIGQLVSKKLIVMGTVIAISMMTIFLSTLLTSGIFWKEIIEPQLIINPDLTKSSVENRVYIWPIAWKLTLQKFLTGYGLENISQAFADYFTNNKHPLFEENLKIYPVLISLKELNIDRSHNYSLDLLLFSGILGLSTWILLVTVMIKKLSHSPVKLETTSLIVGLIIYLIWIQFQNQSIVHLIYFWLLAGLINQKDLTRR